MAIVVPEIIGRGTWLDKVAHDVLDRQGRLGRLDQTIRVESGLGASGIPHLGSFGDGARAWGVKMALSSAGSQSEFIAFSDDKDGLRKVPAGLPKSLQEYIGFPVSSIPDPFGCHGSYGQHMSALLHDAFEKTGIRYTAKSGNQAYKEGLFNSQIEKILTNAETVGRIIKETLGQEKYTEVLPYFPVCSNCGRISTTRALEYDAVRHVVKYDCGEITLGGKMLKGCGHRGEVDVRKGEGKLSWKVEFAARWSALKVDYEGYGKDLLESVRANDRIMEEVLNETPPHHTRYEHFIDKTGAKLSKSTGNVIAPQLWLRYGPPESLFLLMYKRTVGARPVWIRDVPTYIGEIDDLEDVYLGKKQVSDSKELAKLRGLYEYCWNLRPPDTPTLHVPHNLLVYLAKVAPKGMERDYVLEKLAGYGYQTKDVDKRFDERLQRAMAWASEVETFAGPEYSVAGPERDAVLELAGIVAASDDEAYLQNVIFTIARKHGLEAGRFFKTLYRILIGSESGPRLGPYFVAMGRENVAAALVKAAKSEGGS